MWISALKILAPSGGSQFLQGWGTGAKAVQDTQTEVVDYRRYRCTACQRTFRYYPPGVDRTHLTQRIRKIAGMAWALGLSAREAVEVFSELGVELNYMAVWREGAPLINRLKDHFWPRPAGALFHR